MSEPTTSNPLHASPNAGVDSEHSAYYRRLLSAGYKGHVQGGIGGATLYGSFGLVIGAIVGIPLAPFTGGASLFLIPALGGLGALEGAKTFADIGSHAAIMADSAETNEKRRLLLDQLRATDNPLEKEAINRQLADQLASKPVSTLFHWKTVAVGALLGGALALGAMLLAPMVIPQVLAGLALHMGMASGAAGVVAAFTLPAVLAGTAIGALSGAAVGIDREYVRRWLDSSESLVSERSDPEIEKAARARDAALIQHVADTPGSARPAAYGAHAEGMPLISSKNSSLPFTIAGTTPDKTVANIVNTGRAQAAPERVQGQA